MRLSIDDSVDRHLRQFLETKQPAAGVAHLAGPPKRGLCLAFTGTVARIACLDSKAC